MNRYKYSPENAKIYSRLGVKDTTYEIGFSEIEELIKVENDKTFLDFRCGAGRSSLFLKALGIKRVIGVDHDKNMINQALKLKSEDLDFLLIRERILLRNNSVDGALSTAVFIEIRTLKEMEKACQEIYRVLKPNSKFILMSTNLAAFRSNFRSFQYQGYKDLKSGDLVECIIKGKNSFKIEDTYWEEKDYVNVLREAGFKDIHTKFPKGNLEKYRDTDEKKIAPFIIFKCKKV